MSPAAPEYPLLSPPPPTEREEGEWLRFNDRNNHKIDGGKFIISTLIIGQKSTGLLHPLRSDAVSL